MATLITGGTGLIGAEVARVLLEKGEQGPVLFDFNPSPNRIDDIADQVDVVRGDVGNFSHVIDAVKQARPSVIYHLGAILSVPSDADPASSFHVNAQGTFNVLEAARLFDVPQVIFTSSIGTYGLDIQGETISDGTLQRPVLFYGATKVFGENMGYYYRLKHGLDFRGVRFPSIVGPGVRSPGVAQYIPWVIEECGKGNPYTIYVKPETRVPIMYIRDAARALVMLSDAPKESIETVMYLLAGITPTPSAAELADVVRARIPDAQIDFKPDMQIQRTLDMLRPLDDSNARREWAWKPNYDLEQTVVDFLSELRQNSKRYE